MVDKLEVIASHKVNCRGHVNGPIHSYAILSDNLEPAIIMASRDGSTTVICRHYNQETEDCEAPCRDGSWQAKCLYKK